MYKVYSAMSGGIDSSVSTYLLMKEGYNVSGITMILTEDETASFRAKSLCERLSIPHRVVDLRDEFCREIIDSFASDYENGRTPNPCTLCNNRIKFGRLLDYIGDSYISTGHYVKVEKSSTTDRFLIKKANYVEKDQSYFLYSLNQEVLSRVITPLGYYTKPEVREIASENGFESADSKESQDICFINGSYSDFLENYTGKIYEPGNFIDIDGNILGQHRGIVHYTVGQRKGLGLSLKRPMYVHHIDANANTVVLSDNDDLFSKELVASSFNWVAIECPSESFSAKARIRYRHKEAGCTVHPLSDDRVRIVFDEPQRAVTPGQAAVVYYDDILIGGGTIE